MVEHYFSEVPSSRSRELRFTERLRGRDLSFESDAGVFSKSRVDRGTRLLAEAVELTGDELILDWGCGVGPIGIAVALDAAGGRVIMVDINSRAVDLSLRNARLNGVTNVEVRQGNGFEVVPEMDLDIVVSNPPIRAGKQVVYPLVDDAEHHLKSGGRLIVVAKTNQGAKSLAKKMETVFGNVSELEKGSGFRVLQSTKTLSWHGNGGPDEA